MDILPLSTSAVSTTSVSKRRRFAPSSYSFTPYCEDTAIESRDFDSPLLLQLNGQTPTQSDIEAELFRVGMRIRKSVTEGYKTTSFTPRPFFDMNRLSSETQAALCSSNSNRQPISTATFCGINLAALAHVRSTPYEEPRIWRYTSSHKRGYADDSDSDDPDFMPQTPKLRGFEESMAIPVDYFSIDYNDIEEISPFTVPDENQPPRSSGRRIAVPKSRRVQCPETQQQTLLNTLSQSHTPFQLNGTQWMGHKRMTSCGTHTNASPFDFGEAHFLQRREDIEMDCS